MSAVPGSSADYNIEISARRNGSSPTRPVHAAWGDKAFEWLTKTFAFLVFSILAAILITLVLRSTLSIEKYGLSFFLRDAWNPVKGDFGPLGPIYGTLLTSLI